jgi:hypothetical protein
MRASTSEAGVLQIPVPLALGGPKVLCTCSRSVCRVFPRVPYEGAAPVRTTKGKWVQREQTVLEMVEEVLGAQAKALADETGQPLDWALEIVANTEAGRLLRELRDGPHRHVKARDWQADLACCRAEERLMHLMASGMSARPSAHSCYTWVEDYLVRLEGKEAREEYYAVLEGLRT